MPLTPGQVRKLLEPHATRAAGVLTDAMLETAGAVHPLLGKIASEIVGYALEQNIVGQLTGVIEDALRELLGDDYPVVIEAARVDFEGFEHVEEI